MAEPWLLQIWTYCCFMLHIQYLSSSRSVWFCVKIHKLYRVGITKTKPKIFHCWLLNKDNSTWLSVLRFFWVLCMLLLRSNYMDFSNTLQTPSFSWPEAALPHNHAHNLFIFWTSFTSTIFSSVHHSILMLFNPWRKLLATFWNGF